MLSVSVDRNYRDQIWADPIQVPVGPVTKARATRFKERLNELMLDVWVDKSLRAVKDFSKFVNLV